MRKYYTAIAMVAVIGIVLFAGVCHAQGLDEKVKTAMKMLQEKTAALGQARFEGNMFYLGDTEMNGNYEVVDEVANNNGCTATIFAAAGEDYRRISTNVIKEGSRAVGTILDPNGPAIKKIKVGEAYYGEADILGNKYQTGYEPIKDPDGKVIGILYVGYKI